MKRAPTLAIVIVCSLALAGSAFADEVFGKSKYECPRLKNAQTAQYFSYDVKGRVRFLGIPLPLTGFKFPEAIHLEETENDEEKAVCVYGKAPFANKNYEAEGMVFSRIPKKGGEEDISIKYRIGDDSKTLRVVSSAKIITVFWKEQEKFLPPKTYRLEGDDVHNGVFAFMWFLRGVESSGRSYETAFPLNKGLYRAKFKPKKTERGIILKVLLFPIKILEKEEELEDVKILVQGGRITTAEAVYTKYRVLSVKAKITLSGGF